jgi:hypothetical protein
MQLSDWVLVFIVLLAATIVGGIGFLWGYCRGARAGAKAHETVYAPVFYGIHAVLLYAEKALEHAPGYDQTMAAQQINRVLNEWPKDEKPK